MADPAALGQIADAVARLTGRPVISCAPIPSTGGFSDALRLQARFADGETVFVKVATNGYTAQWLRTESIVYHSLGEREFLPRYHGLMDDPAAGVTGLVLEDLSAARWPPPWRDSDVPKVLAALGQFHTLAHALPAGFLTRQEDQRPDFAGWQRVAADPRPFLSLGLCSREWLENALPTLIAADAAAVLDGDDLIHQDIRGDNLCLTADGRAVIVDWNWVCVGNGKVDIAGWLPSLHAEGGPPPEQILPNEPELAAILAGYWAFNAGLPPPDFSGGERVRAFQRRVLGVAFAWAVRALGLPGL